MPGGRLRNPRFGDTDEKIAEAILSFIAFTTSVPREEDVGHDFVCALIEHEDAILKAGLPFTVQVKSISQLETFIYEKPYECNWLENQELPFFIGLVDRAKLRIDLYSTWNIHNSYLWKKAESYTLFPGEIDADPSLPFPREEPDCRKHQTIPLGKPVLSITMQEVVDNEKVDQYRIMLREWVALERENILRKGLSLKWIHGPSHYQTNQSLLGPDVSYQDTTYWNPVDLSTGLLTFAQSATSLRNMMNGIIVPEEYRDQWESRVNALEHSIFAFWDDLPGLARGALQEALGQEQIENKLQAARADYELRKKLQD
ncbi:MAG: hypothetical protein PHQ40_07715 [Anaerolineaceae bacterium]|nr:hypothetical protein [Anaerolineaceae bacterium]